MLSAVVDGNRAYTVSPIHVHTARTTKCLAGHRDGVDHPTACDRQFDVVVERNQSECHDGARHIGANPQRSGEVGVAGAMLEQIAKDRSTFAAAGVDERSMPQQMHRRQAGGVAQRFLRPCVEGVVALDRPDRTQHLGAGFDEDRHAVAEHGPGVGDVHDTVDRRGQLAVVARPSRTLDQAVWMRRPRMVSRRASSIGWSRFE